MSINFRYPSITGRTEAEQMAQMKSYMHQMVDQLNYAFSIIETTQEASQAENNKTHNEMKTQLLQEIQRLNSKIDQIHT